MNRPPPPLNFIRSFESAARHLSFTRAAEELGYTQAAISTHIRALEKYVGRNLFVRNARSIELTEMGEAFLPTLRQALAQIDNATDAIATTSRDRSVVVACPMSLAESWLPDIIATFNALHPEVEIVVNGTIWDSPEDGLADLVISVNRHDEVPPGALKLWEETLSLVCAPAMAKRITTVADLTGTQKITVAGRQEYWMLIASALGLEALDFEMGFKTNSSNISLEMAANGLGLTVAMTSLCHRFIARGSLTEPLAIRAESPWGYYIQSRHGRRNSQARKLHDHIVTSGLANRDGA